MSNCIVCNSMDIKLTHKYNHFHFMECQSCGLLFIDQFPDYSARRENFHSEYDSFSADKKKYDYYANNAKRKIKNRLNFIKTITNKEIKNVLEIGAGMGAWCEAFQEIGIQYLGIDINRKAVEIGKEFGAKLVWGDFLNEKLSSEISEKFDLIFASQVFEHIFEPHRFLERIKDFLKKDGIFYFDLPNPAGLISSLKTLPLLSEIYKKEYRCLHPPMHYLAYNDNTIKYLLKLHNYEVLHLSHPGFSHYALGQLGNYNWITKIANIFMTLLNCGSLTAVVSRKSGI